VFNSEEINMESIIEFINPVITNSSQEDQMRYLASVDPEIQKKIEIGKEYLVNLRHAKFYNVKQMFPFDPDNFSEEQFQNIEKGYNYIGNHTYEYFSRFANQQDLVYNFVNHNFLLWYFFFLLLILNSFRVIFILLFDKENRKKEYRGGFGGAIERGLRGVALGVLWYPIVYPDNLNRFYKTFYHTFPNLYVEQFRLFPHFPANLPIVYFEREKYLGLVPTTSYMLDPEPTPHIIKVVYRTPPELVERFGGTEILEKYSPAGKIWHVVKGIYIWLFVPAADKLKTNEKIIDTTSQKTDDFINWLGKDQNFYPVTSDQFYSFTEKIKTFYNETHFNFDELPSSLNRFNFPSDFKSKILAFDFTKWKLINGSDELVKFMNPFFTSLGLPSIDSGQVSIPLQGNANYQQDINWIQNNVNNIFQNEANFEFNRLATLEKDYQTYLKDLELSTKSAYFTPYNIYHTIFDPLLTLIKNTYDTSIPWIRGINEYLDDGIIGLPMFVKQNLGTAFSVLIFSYVLRRGRYYLGRLFRYYLGHTIVIDMLSRFLIPFYFGYYKWVEEPSFILLSDQANEFTKFLAYYKDTHRDEFIFTADGFGWVILALPIILFIASQAEQYFYVKYLTDGALIHIGTRRPGEGD